MMQQMEVPGAVLVLVVQCCMYMYVCNIYIFWLLPVDMYLHIRHILFSKRLKMLKAEKSFVYSYHVHPCPQWCCIVMFFSGRKPETTTRGSYSQGGSYSSSFPGRATYGRDTYGVPSAEIPRGKRPSVIGAGGLQIPPTRAVDRNGSDRLDRMSHPYQETRSTISTTSVGGVAACGACGIFLYKFFF